MQVCVFDFYKQRCRSSWEAMLEVIGGLTTSTQETRYGCSTFTKIVASAEPGDNFTLEFFGGGAVNGAPNSRASLYVRKCLPGEQ